MGQLQIGNPSVFLCVTDKATSLVQRAVVERSETGGIETGEEEKRTRNCKRRTE